MNDNRQVCGLLAKVLISVPVAATHSKNLQKSYMLRNNEILEQATKDCPMLDN